MFGWHAFAEPYLIPLQLVLAMAGIGATLSMAALFAVFRRPAALLTGVALQWLLVPLLAVAMIRLAGLTPGWAIGLLLIAAAPAGSMSNLFTYLGRGNVALAISLTGVTTLGCLFTVPILLQLLA